MEKRLEMEDGEQIRPFCAVFLWVPTHIFVEDEMGVTQDIPQEEGARRPLMTMLFSLGHKH